MRLITLFETDSRAFVDHSTSTAIKAIKTREAEDRSKTACTGTGLCVYLVGDPGSGLARHVHEKQRLGFNDLSKHIIVEFVPKTALALAQQCQKEYPEINVVCGTLEGLPEAILSEIEHLDYDGTKPFNWDSAEFVNKAAEWGVNNIHFIGQTRRAADDIKLPKSAGGPEWKDVIIPYVDNPEYELDYDNYNSGGPIQPNIARRVNLETKGGTFDGYVTAEDYALLTKIMQWKLLGYGKAIDLEGSVGSRPSVDLYADKELKYRQRNVGLRAVQKAYDTTAKFTGSPMFMIVMNHKNPSSYNVSSEAVVGVLSKNYTNLDGFERFFVEPTKVTELTEILNPKPKPVARKKKRKEKGPITIKAPEPGQLAMGSKVRHPEHGTGVIEFIKDGFPKVKVRFTDDAGITQIAKVDKEEIEPVVESLTIAQLRFISSGN
jgi:hypothetical protein